MPTWNIMAYVRPEGAQGKFEERTFPYDAPVIPNSEEAITFIRIQGYETHHIVKIRLKLTLNSMART